MKAYGRRKHDDLVYEFGPPTKEWGGRSRNANKYRRILHKQGRSDSMKEQKEQEQDLFEEELDTFIAAKGWWD